MSPPLLGVEEEAQSKVSLAGSSSPTECVSHNASCLKERNYLGLSDCSSVDSSSVNGLPEDEKNNLNLRATELRLGLPGSELPEREADLCSLKSAKLDEKPLFPLFPSKNVVSGNKRGFSETVMVSSGSQVAQSVVKKDVPQNVRDERSNVTKGPSLCQAGSSTNTSTAPAAKAQVVGWPPIRSYRKNTLTATSKNNDEVDGKPGPGALFVKVSMDGAPYLRKVDLRTYTTYRELSSALEKMFSCFTLGQYGCHGAPGRERLSESKLKDLLHGSEYVLTYEDKDGDWMLVGDVPWEMFIESCKKLKIMKSSDAIGLVPTAPRAAEKSRNRS